jgi:uncharacterized membrane protein
MYVRYAALCTLVVAAMLLAGCPNPNAIGVQVYGQVNVHVQDANGQPVANALVAIGNNAQSTDAGGNTSFAQIPVGTWTVSADAPGLHGSSQVTVQENQTSNVVIAMQPM